MAVNPSNDKLHFIALGCSFACQRMHYPRYPHACTLGPTLSRLQTVQHTFRVGAIICSAPANESENNREQSQQMSWYSLGLIDGVWTVKTPTSHLSLSWNSMKGAAFGRSELLITQGPTLRKEQCNKAAINTIYHQQWNTWLPVMLNTECLS